MATAASSFSIALSFVFRHKDIAIAFVFATIIGVMIVPLFPAAMDVLIGFNILFSVILLMTTIYIDKPLSLSSFPSLLLITTLYRLALNVATTRMILSTAHELRMNAAGHIVRSFGEVVAGSNPVIGFVIFLILTIIQFIVITKGTTRIAEVQARFSLDAMPGKQMAIDADLNAGLIDEQDARARRLAITRETDFYGSMDGASKFVRGDAIAGIIITIINIVGGFIIGMWLSDMSAAEVASVYTKLSIGDGLVTQVPALIVSVSAALLVTRSASTHNLGDEIIGQLFTLPKALIVGACVLILLSFTGLGSITLIPMAGLCFLGAYVIVRQSKKKIEEDAKAIAEQKTKVEKPPEKVETLLRVDPMELMVGHALIRMVDPAAGGDLLERITMMRRQIALEMGLVVPPIRIRDNMELSPNNYVIKFHDAEIARDTLYPEKILAMDPGTASEPIEGLKVTEPAFGLPAFWVTEAQRDRAMILGYTIVDATSVLVTHLTEVIKNHAHELLTREKVNDLITQLKETSPRVVDEVTKDMMSIGEVQKVLQNLLRERVSIKNMEMILETLGDYGRRTKSTETLTEYCRAGLARNICRDVAEADGKIYVVALDPRLEDEINRCTERTEYGGMLNMSPARERTIVQAISREVEKLVLAGHQGVLLCSPLIRSVVRRMIEHTMPSLVVLSHNEIVPEVEVHSLGLITVT